MLQVENLFRAERVELDNELALLESCVISLGFDSSLAAKILQKATYESIETGRPTLDILREYRDKLRMGIQYGGD